MEEIRNLCIANQNVIDISSRKYFNKERLGISIVLLRRNQLWHNNMPTHCLNAFCPESMPTVQGEFRGQKSTTSQINSIFCFIKKYVLKICYLQK